MKTKILLFVSLVLLAARPAICSPDDWDTGYGGLGWDEVSNWNEQNEALQGSYEREWETAYCYATMPKVKADKKVVFKNGTVNKSITKKFLVTWLHYGNGTETISVELEDNTGMYTIDKTSITCTGNGAWGANGSDYITVTYTPTTRGSHSAKIYINRQDEDAFCRATVKIEGSAEERHVTATGSASFNLVVGESDSTPIHVKGTNLTGPLTVELNDKTGMYSIDKESITADEAAKGIDVMVTYNPSSVGTHGADVTISGGDALETIVLIMSGHCELPTPTITVDETDLDFGTVILGQESHRDIEVKCSNLNGYLMLETHDPCYTVIPDRISPQEAAIGKKVTVTYKPTAAGTHNDFMGISCGLSGGPIVNLTGKCVANPTITVNPTSLDFETIEVGHEKPITLNVTGTDLIGPITLLKEETIGDQFSINKETLSANGGSVIVTYKPTEAGTHGGCIRISSGGANPVSISLTGSARELSVTKSSLDFGTIKKNETATRSFTVFGGNLLGNITLMSSNRDLFEVIPETITPAEAKVGKEVTVTYKPTAGGTNSGKIIVSAEGVTNKEVSVSGKCAEIKVNRTSLNFGTIEVGKDTTITLNVTGTNVTGMITLLKEETVGNQFSINKETLSASGGSVFVTFKPTEAGTHGGYIRISGEGADPVSVSLTGSARQLSVTKTSLDFGTTKKNGTVTRKFTVYGGNLSGNVTLSSSNAKFTVSPASITPAEAKAGKEVTVTFKPAAGGTYSGKIIVSASGVTPQNVSVSGKCAVITTNPTSYNFGNVAVGKPVTKEITITGTNVTSSITISVEETEGGQFTINKSTLPASGGIVTVTFKATDAKTFGAALRISGGSAEAVSVNLTGKGVTPTITRNKSELDFSGSEITSDYVKITGTNLDDVISLEVTGSGRTHFILSTSTISISDAASGKQVKVTCNPKNASSADATLKISSPYATTKYVTLKYRKGTSGGGETQICSVEPEGGNEGGNDEFNNEFMEGGSLEVMSATTTDVDELAMNSKVYAEGQSIIIESPVEQSAIISDISGHAQSVNLNIGRNEIPVNASGIYIVRIREKTTKLMLK